MSSKWDVSVSAYGGEPESATVDAETVGEATEKALEELGFDGNDEGSYKIAVELADE